MKKYDLCVIGGGPSGYAAAMRAVDFSKSVVLVERDKVGGAGVYNGALTSKTMWELSRTAAAIRKHTGKYVGNQASIMNYEEVKNEVNEAVYERKSLLEHHLYWLDQRMPDNLFASVKGSGRMLTDKEIEITKPDGTKETIFAENTILAMGSRPRFLPNVAIDEQTIVTSDGINNFSEYPKSLVIIGAGVIGCEFASIFSNFGKTKVYLVAREDRILPFEDADVSRVIETNMEANGVTIFKHSGLVRMEVKDGEVEYEISTKDMPNRVFKAEKALISVGRVPNIEGTGITEVGVRLTPQGYIEDNDTRTSVPNIYAVGDLTADIALVNVGELEGRHAVEKIFSDAPSRVVYDNISTIMFLNPEAAGVGLNEQQAKKQGIPYKVVTYDYSCIARAVAMRNTQGFFKILVTDDEHMKVLGMRALGEHASSAIQAVALLISMNKGIEELAELIHPHPSIIEGVQECVRMLMGKSIFKPSAFRDTLQCRRCSREGVYEDLFQLAGAEV